MIANRISFENGYWHLNASLFCDMHDYRREGGGTGDSWEHLENKGSWEPELLSEYCEDLLRAFIANDGKIKQVFVNW
jgi:hypothetical protein